MLRWFIRATISAVAIAILVSIIPVDAVTESLRRVSVWTWSASVLIFFSGHYLNALKLRILLEPAGTANSALTAACLRAQYAGLVANLGLPGLAGGDFVRAAYLAPLTGLKRVAVASVADRLIDTATLVALIAVALPLAGIPAGIAGPLRDAAVWIIAGLSVVSIAALILLRLRLTTVRQKVWLPLVELTERKSALVMAAAISLAVQSAFVVTNVWLAREVGVTTSLASWFVAWPLSKLIAVLPISLGGIGVREGALVALLAPFGAEREAVLASGVLWQAVLIVTGFAGLAITQLMPRTPAGHVAPLAKET